MKCLLQDDQVITDHPKISVLSRLMYKNCKENHSKLLAIAFYRSQFCFTLDSNQ